MKNEILRLKKFNFNQAIFPEIQIRFQEEHLNEFQDVNLIKENLIYEGSSLLTPFYKIKEIEFGNI